MSLVLVRRHVPVRQKSESAAPSLEADCSRTALLSQPGRADDMERPVSHRQSLSAGTGLWPALTSSACWARKLCLSQGQLEPWRKQPVRRGTAAAPGSSRRDMAP